MSIAEFYLMNSRYYNGGVDMGLDIYNPFDDDYYDHYRAFDYDDYDYSGSDYMGSLDGRSDEEFLELCLPPRCFPDSKKFPVEWVRRAMKIRSDNYHPLKALPGCDPLSDKLELPIFEQLWESLFYLKEITSVGMSRVENFNGMCDVDDEMAKDIWKSSVEYFSSFPKDTQDIADHWFGWCNDLFIEAMQSLIPSTLPYIAWVSIISHLSRAKYDENRTLLTKIGTISEDKEAQIIERFMIRECILRIGDITRIFYRCLHSELVWMDITFNKIKQTLPTLLKGLNLSMDRLLHFLETPSECPSKFVDYSVIKNFSTNISYFVDNGSEDEAGQKDLDILKVVHARTDDQNNAYHFTMLIADNEQENVYHLLCIDKNCMDSQNNVDYFYEQKALLSEGSPRLFCCGDLVAGIGSSGQNSIELTVWDMSEKSRKLNLKEIDERWREVYPEIWPVSLSDVKIRGMVKCDKKILVMFHISQSCMIADYGVTEGLWSFKQKRLTLFENSVPLGVHSTTAFVMNLQKNVLVMLDIKDPDDAIACKISFKYGKDWKMQFNSDPNSELCILYKGNNLQVRKLDHELTLVKELTLDLDCFSISSLFDTLELHFFDNMVYGFMNNHANIPYTNEEFLKQTEEKDRSQSSLVNFLTDRFLKNTEHDLHFLVDTDTAEKGLIGIDWGSHGCDGPNGDVVEDVVFSEEVDIETFLIGFNRKGELVKLTMNVDVDTCSLESNKQVAICKCSAFSFATVKVFNTLNEARDMMLPSVQKVFDLLKEEEEKREALKREQEELKKKMEEEFRRKEKVKENVKEKVKEYIRHGSTVKATIDHWKHCEGYGFATIDIDVDDGEEGKQEVFVHKTCVTTKERKHLHSGTSMQCQLKWDSNRPRPQAVNVKLL